VRLENPGQNQAHVRVPDREVGSALIQLLNIAERQWNADSQSTEMDRGSQLQSTRSATEASILDNRAQTQSIYTKREALRLAQRVVEAAMMVAEVVDRDPVEVDLFGHNIVLNDPQDPRLRLDEVLREPSMILINPQSLEGSDTNRKTMEALSKLQPLQPFVGVPGGIPLRWFLEQTLKALGYEDVDEVLGSHMEAMGMPGLAGGMAPGQPAQPGAGSAAAPAIDPAMLSQLAGAAPLR